MPQDKEKLDIYWYWA